MRAASGRLGDQIRAADARNQPCHQWIGQIAVVGEIGIVVEVIEVGARSRRRHDHAGHGRRPSWGFGRAGDGRQHLGRIAETEVVQRDRAHREWLVGTEQDAMYTVGLADTEHRVGSAINLNGPTIDDEASGLGSRRRDRRKSRGAERRSHSRRCDQKVATTECVVHLRTDPFSDRTGMSNVTVGRDGNAGCVLSLARRRSRERAVLPSADVLSLMSIKLCPAYGDSLGIYSD